MWEYSTVFNIEEYFCKIVLIIQQTLCDNVNTSPGVSNDPQHQEEENNIFLFELYDGH